MKKLKSKKGFTLVEVLLSVAILSMLSLMILNGFMATMNYSANTSIYSRVANSNQYKTMSQVAIYSNATVEERQAFDSPIAIKNTGGSNIVFKFQATPANLPNLSATKWREINGASSYGAQNIAAGLGYGESMTYADNRSSFFYTPAEALFKCPTCGHYGYVNLYRHAGAKAYYCRWQNSEGVYCNTKIADYGG